MDNFDLRKYLAEGRLFEEDMTSKAVSVLKSYKGEVKGLEDYIKYLMNTSDDISSSIQAVADDMDRDNDAEDSLRRDLEKLSLAEGKLYETPIPSGWKKIDTSNDYEEEERQGRLMGFEAPMSGIEGDEVDNIYIEQDGDEYEVHVMTAFNNPEYEGPFSSKEEALKVAIQKMEDLKKDWDE
jgi:hypothetical protein